MSGVNSSQTASEAVGQCTSSSSKSSKHLCDTPDSLDKKNYHGNHSLKERSSDMKNSFCAKSSRKSARSSLLKKNLDIEHAHMEAEIAKQRAQLQADQKRAELEAALKMAEIEAARQRLTIEEECQKRVLKLQREGLDEAMEDGGSSDDSRKHDFSDEDMVFRDELGTKSRDHFNKQLKPSPAMDEPLHKGEYGQKPEEPGLNGQHQQSACNKEKPEAQTVHHVPSDRQFESYPECWVRKHRDQLFQQGTTDHSPIEQAQNSSPLEKIKRSGELGHQTGMTETAGEESPTTDLWMMRKAHQTVVQREKPVDTWADCVKPAVEKPAQDCGDGNKLHQVKALGPQGFMETEDKPQSPPTGSDFNKEMVSYLRSLQSRLELPRPDIKGFNGDPTDYARFQMAFRSYVEARTTNPGELYQYLRKYCTDKAADVIRKYDVLLDPVEAWKQATRALWTNFGQPHIIIQEIEKKVSQFSEIKSGDRATMKRYAELLDSSLIALQSLGKEDAMNHPTYLVNIVSKLPACDRRAWLKKAGQIRGTQKAVQFRDVTEFIKELSKALNDTEFAVVLDSKKSGDVQRGDFRRKTSHAMSHESEKVRSPASQTSAHNGPKKSNYQSMHCRSCPGQAEHIFWKCPKFANKPVQARLREITRHRLCYNCLNESDHTHSMAKDCPLGKECRTPGCRSDSKHNTLLHRDKADWKQPAVEDGKVNSCVASSGDGVFFQVFGVRVRSPVTGKTVETCAVVDSCSSTSLCSEDLLRQLGVPSNPQPLNLKTAHGWKEQPSTLTSLEVSNLDDEGQLIIPRVYSWSEIPVDGGRAPCENVWRGYDHLKDLYVRHPADRRINLLVGSDVPRAHIQLEYREGRVGEPVAFRNLWGWSLLGSGGDAPWIECNLIQHHRSGKVKLEESLEELSQQLESIAELEYAGTKNMFDHPVSVEDVVAREILENKSYWCQGRYYVPMPLKDSYKTLPNNREVAAKRLCSITRKLRKDPNVYEEYKRTFVGYLKDGYIRRIPEDELLTDGVVNYLPFHHVTHPRKPGKIRIVWDAATKYHGTSLNDHLYTGEDRLNSLLGVLLRFRLGGESAVQGDINAMFNRVCAIREDWDLMRFLWYENHDIDARVVEYQQTVTFFGGAHSPGNATYALHRVAADNQQDFGEQVCKSVKRNFYMDDFLMSGSLEVMKVTVSEIIPLLERGGFRLAKFVTSDPELREMVPADRLAKVASDKDLPGDDAGRVLGVVWNAREDTLSFKVDAKEKPFSRRGLLGHIASLFDPEGSLAPVLLPPKMLLHRLTREGLKWDQPMPKKDKEWLCHWLASLEKLSTVRRGRYHIPKGFGSVVRVELHAMSDGAEAGYGFVLFSRVVRSDGRSHVGFLLGKALVAPKRIKTIPRLELQACLLSLRACSFVMAEADMAFDSVYQWTDSTVVLQMLRNKTRRFQTFVGNRVQDMREIIHELKVEMRHVPTHDNVADDCSRGQTVEQFLRNERYYRGPAFLWESPSAWPGSPILEELPDDFPEFRKEASVCATTADDESLMKLVKRYSSWTKLKIAVAWLVRFLCWLTRAKGIHPAETSVDSDRISVAEIRKSEVLILKYVQSRCFADVIAKLGEGGPRMQHKEINNLRPFIDEAGLLRVGGRLDKANISYGKKHQIILPKSHHVTTIISREYHVMHSHAPPRTLLYLLREKFWPIGGPRLVYGMEKRCIECQKVIARPKEQLQGSLPKSRVETNSLWGVVGADVMGPVLVRIGRSDVKRWILGIVSFSVKAVHFELLPSLDTAAFLNALRRFISRRSRPTEMITDNAGNFAAGLKEINALVEVWNSSGVADFMRQREIVWRPNVPKASARNGLFERPFRALRRAMLTALKGQTSTEDQLATVVAECELLYNSRPLCALSQSADDLLPLRPVDIINPEPGNACPPGLFEKRDSLVRNRFRQTQYIVQQFWSRFLKEYLSTLQERQKSIAPSRNFEVGDLCLLTDELVLGHRGFWPLCRVTEVHQSEDGCVRVVRVKTAQGQYNRPVNKICLLEAASGLG